MSGALYPAASLLRASNGLIYGTTEAGGANGNGTIFELNVTTDPPSVVVRHSFVRDVTGRRPVAGLVDVGGLLYGTASERGPGFNGTIFSFDPGIGTTTVLHAFGPTGPYQPAGGPIEVGPSFIGASEGGGPLRGGTVFKWEPSTGSVTVMYSFDPLLEGGYPSAGVIRGSDGRVYGTAAVGGPATCGVNCTTQDAGMVYRIDANGANFTILKSFSTNPGDAYTPGGRLLETNGALFGTLQNGGAHSGGAVFRIDSSGAFSLVHQFDPAIDGSVPNSGLTQGSDGLLYGTTSAGGQHNGGTAFRMDTSGGAFEVLHAFDPSNPLDAAGPQSALVQVGPSVFMGTTPAGGLFGNGTVYKLDVSTSPPTVVVLRSFEACCPSAFGSSPMPNLVKGAGGWVYGMTSFGGPTGFGGTIFGITPNGTIRLLHQFGFSEGSGPIGMTIADDGSFYGTTRYGGLNWGGILFRLRVDADGDGVRDPVDNCPTAANPAQIDTDGDGIGDGCPPDGPQAHVARLTLGTLQFTYDGTPKATTVTATPIEALQTGVLTVTYNGSTTPPTNAGLYTVVASLANPNYSTADVSAFMVIQQAPSIVTWNAPAHIFNPTPLSATQLNATANVPGTFAYMPDIGTVLPIGNNQQLTVEFTPTDSVNYTRVLASVTIDVRGFTVVDTTPPVVTAPRDISVLATQAAGADGNAVYYPYIGTPLPTLAGFLAGATATDDLSQPVQLPTELRSCQTNALVDPDVSATTVFPLGTNVNCVFFRFRDAGGNIGSAMAVVHVYPGTVAPAGSSQPVPALGPTGLPTGVSLEFEGGVTVAGTVGASCQRNPATTTGADFLFDVDPPIVECGTLPDGTPRTCGAAGDIFGSSYTIACDISTTAQFQGRIKVCFPHVYGRDTLWHYNSVTGQWEDITIRPVLANQKICGWVSSLSPFVVNAAPELLLPSNLTVEAASASGSTVNYTAAAVDAEDGNIPVNCTPVSGTLLPLGTTIVACSAADASGTAETASFSIAVVDTTPPVVTAPPAITVEATQSSGATASSSPALAQWLASATAVDLVDGAPTGGAQATPSTVFPVGTTTVTFRFVDKKGNAGVATSRVTVVSGKPRITVSIAGRGPVSGTKQYVDLRFTNSGGASALRGTTLLVPVAVRGYGLIKVASPSQPIAIGDLGPGASRVIRVVLDVPATVKEFLLVEAGAYWLTSGAPAAFAETQTLVR